MLLFKHILFSFKKTILWKKSDTITFPLCFYQVSKSKDYFLMSSFNQLFSLPSPIQSKNIPVALFQNHLYSKSFHLKSYVFLFQMGHSKFKEEQAVECASRKNSQTPQLSQMNKKMQKKKKKLASQMLVLKFVK